MVILPFVWRGYGVCALNIGPLTLNFADFPWISGDFYGMKLARVGAFTDFGTF